MKKKKKIIGNILINFLFRLERLDHLAQKFRHKCEIHEEWATGKEDMLKSGDFKRCRLNELKVECCFQPE